MLQQHSRRTPLYRGSDGVDYALACFGERLKCVRLVTQVKKSSTWPKTGNTTAHVLTPFNSPHHSVDLRLAAETTLRHHRALGYVRGRMLICCDAALCFVFRTVTDQPVASGRSMSMKVHFRPHPYMF